MKRVFDTPGAVLIDVQVSSGRVELAASDATETEVQITPVVDDDASRRAVAESRVDMHGNHDRSVVHIEVPRRGFSLLSAEPHVLVTVQVPVGTDVDAIVSSADVNGNGHFGSLRVKSASGDLTFENVGEVDLKTASGDVSLEDVAGSARIQSASGDLKIDRIGGAAKFQSASGDVAVDRANSDIKVQTASGDVRINTVVSGQASLQSASGDMRIGIARGSTLWVDAKSLSGDTTSELEVGDEPPDIEGPHVDLRAKTMSGDIHIAREDALI